MCPTRLPRGGQSVDGVGEVQDYTGRVNKNRSNSHDSLLLSKQAKAIARTAAMEMEEGEVGPHLGTQRIGATTAIHRFVADVDGYGGWEWNVVLAAVADSDHITVSEVLLLPGRGALQAPEWVPYADRIRPGDLKPGLQLPPQKDDQRLTDNGGLEFSGHSSTTHLTHAGLDAALSRWTAGEFGPRSASAKQAKLHCETCAFFVPIAALGGFGVCVNEFSADGRVVATTYGCGAHSDTPPATTLS